MAASLLWLGRNVARDPITRAAEVHEATSSTMKVASTQNDIWSQLSAARLILVS
jgi:hypothetical protein